MVLCSVVAAASADWDSPSYGGIHEYGPAPLAHDGSVIDTADVAHAKAEHYAAHAKAAGASAHHNYAAHAWAPAPAAWAPEEPSHDSYIPKWNGPLAHIELTHDGKYVRDTPEVAHARAEHLSAHAHAHHGYGPDYTPSHYHEAAYNHNLW